MRTSAALPRLCLLIACGAGVISAAAQAQPYQAFPIDEGIEVPEFLAWRDRLIEAVRRRDTEAVVALADPNIRLSFGDANGREQLRMWLNGVDAVPWSGAAYWHKLERTLALGGTWQDIGDERGQYFCAPYTFSAEFPPEMDVFDVVMVIQPEAQLHSGPSRSDPVVATLDYDIAEITDNSDFDPENPVKPYWLGIRTANGVHEGYVNSTAVRSPVDYRACFGRGADGGWIWDLFVAGD